MLTRIQTMKTLPLAEVKARLSALVSEVEAEHEQVTITRNGVAAALVVSIDEWESLHETIAVLSDPGAIADLHAAAASSERYGTDQVLAEFQARRGRLA